MTAITKKIMLLRHAKAESEAARGDHERALTVAGRQDAENLGQHLRDVKLIPQSIYCSSASRAMQTANIICEQLLIDPSQITTRETLYLANTDLFLSLLQGLNNRIRCVMIVGHNPTLETVVASLRNDLATAPTKDIHLSPASLVVLEFDGDWSSLNHHSCFTKQVIHGKQL